MVVLNELVMYLLGRFNLGDGAYYIILCLILLITINIILYIKLIRNKK